MSQPQSELNDAVGRLRAEEAKEQAPVSAEADLAPRASAEPEASESGNEDLDPLSAYIEEVETEEVVAEPKAAAPESAKQPEPAVPAGTATMGMSSIPAAHILVQKAPTKISQPEVKKTETAPIANGSGHEGSNSTQKVIVESGMRRPGKGSQLSFGKPKQPEMREPTERPAASQPEAPVKAPQAMPRNTVPVEHEPVEHQEEEQVMDSRVEASEKARQQSAPASRSREVQQGEQTQHRAAPSSPNKVVKAAVAGRLFGWLVHYAEPDGVATELREGKFFVTASSLKATDLIVDEPSISTPHALIVVSTEIGLQVQDLMSDRGVFVRRRGADSYQREYEVVSVEHGDWVRFGDVEYLVSLIAHVGAK
jgi:hypothetical protein